MIGLIWTYLYRHWEWSISIAMIFFYFSYVFGAKAMWIAFGRLMRCAFVRAFRVVWACAGTTRRLLQHPLTSLWTVLYIAVFSWPVVEGGPTQAGALRVKEKCFGVGTTRKCERRVYSIRGVLVGFCNDHEQQRGWIERHLHQRNHR